MCKTFGTKTAQNGLFCYFSICSDLGLNPFIYGGCRDFRHNSALSFSDPFGVMRDLTTLLVYKEVNVMVLVDRM
jgi:hypothetical protein